MVADGGEEDEGWTCISMNGLSLGRHMHATDAPTALLMTAGEMRINTYGLLQSSKEEQRSHSATSKQPIQLIAAYLTKHISSQHPPFPHQPCIKCVDDKSFIRMALDTIGG